MVGKNTSTTQVELSGGPPNPGAWKRWSKDGAELLSNTLQALLSEAGYQGQFQLRGAQGKRGNSECTGQIHVRDISAVDNSIVIDAQPGSAMSRWRYKLFAPQTVDVVELHAHLDRHFSVDAPTSDHATEDANKQSDAECVDSTEEGVDQNTLPPGEQSSVPELRGGVPTEEAGDGYNMVIAKANGTSRPCQISQADLLNIIAMGEEYKRAEALFQKGDLERYNALPDLITNIECDLTELEKRITALQREADALNKKVTELRQEQGLYEEEYGRAKAILADDCYRAAAEKLLAISKIMET